MADAGSSVPPDGKTITEHELAQCQRAIHDYRDAHGITEEIVDIDGFGAYWRKAL